LFRHLVELLHELCDFVAAMIDIVFFRARSQISLGKLLRGISQANDGGA
jgi:hypothetical protein